MKQSRGAVRDRPGWDIPLPSLLKSCLLTLQPIRSPPGSNQDLITAAYDASSVHYLSHGLHYPAPGALVNAEWLQCSKSHIWWQVFVFVFVFVSVGEDGGGQSSKKKSFLSIIATGCSMNVAEMRFLVCF